MRKFLYKQQLATLPIVLGLLAFVLDSCGKEGKGTGGRGKKLEEYYGKRSTEQDPDPPQATKPLSTISPEEQLRALEAELVQKRIQLELVEKSLDRDRRSKQTVAHQSERRKYYKEKAAKADERAEKAEKGFETLREEMMQEMHQKRLTAAKLLLKMGKSKEEVLAATELTEEDLNSISKPESDPGTEPKTEEVAKDDE